MLKIIKITDYIQEGDNVNMLIDIINKNWDKLMTLIPQPKDSTPPNKDNLINRIKFVNTIPISRHYLIPESIEAINESDNFTFF